jgi:hypothetical protein
LTDNSGKIIILAVNILTGDYPPVPAGLVFLAQALHPGIHLPGYFQVVLPPNRSACFDKKFGLQLKVRWMIFRQVDHSATIHPDMAVKVH